MHWISHTFYRLRLNGCEGQRPFETKAFWQLKKEVKTSSVWLSLEKQSQPQAISARLVNVLHTVLEKHQKVSSCMKALQNQLSLLVNETFSAIFKHSAYTLQGSSWSYLLVIGSWHSVQKSLILHAVLPSATRVSSFVINSALVQSISLHRFVFLSTRERQIGRAYRVYAVFFSKFQMGICAEREIGTLKENRILSNTVLR